MNIVISFLAQNAYRFSLIGILLLLFILGFFHYRFQSKSQDVIPSTYQGRQVMLGLWSEGFWNNSEKTLHPEKIADTETLLGTKVTIAHHFRGWEEITTDGFIPDLETIHAHGWVPMVSFNPYFSDHCTSDLPLYRAIAEGVCDTHLRNISKQIKAYGKPIYLRFAWEMNVPAMPWEITKTGSTNEDFIAAWRHFYQIMQEEQATNGMWVFSPATEDHGDPYSSFYPGNEFVDWLAVDGYNWGTTQTWSSWKSFNDVFGPSYVALTALSSEKPIMLAEINSTHIGGDKAAWYQDMLDEQIPNNYPQVKAIVFFNEDRTEEEKVNWLFTADQASLNQLKKSLAQPIYQK